MKAELNLLNHVLKTKDIVTPLAANAEASFTAYKDEWLFIKDYYTKYKEVPPVQVFTNAFPGIDIYNTDGVIEFYIEELHKDRARAVLGELLTEAAITLRDGGPYTVIKKLNRTVSKLGKETRLIKDTDLVANADERLACFREGLEIRRSGRRIRGIPSGIDRMDNIFGGWQPGDLIVVAGWTGSYKSWLALMFAVNAWREGYRVLYFSLEMSAIQVGYRFDTMVGGFNNNALVNATDEITYDHYKNWMDTELKDHNAFIVVTNEDLEEVNQNTVQAKIEQWNPDVTFLDYHGLFDDAGGATGETEKAQPLDAKILTPCGWKLMGEIEVGDEVVGSDGKPTLVTGLSPQKIKPIYKITMNEGSSTECCEEHLWAVNTRTRNHRGNKYLVKPLSDLSNDLKTGEGGIKWSIPIPDVVQFENKDITVDPYLLGLLIGDGSFVGSGLHFSTSDKELVDYIRNVIPDTHSITKRNGPDTYGYYITGEGFRGQNTIISGIRELGLWGKRGEFKFVPELYLHNSENVRRDILAGLLDSDGSASGGTTVFYSSSKELAENVCELVSSLGGTSLTTMFETTHLPSWRVHININVNPFRLKRKAELWHSREKYGPYRGIKNIDYVGEKLAQCIRVSNEDGLYITDDFILTHNCKNLSKDFKRIAMKTGTAIVDISAVTMDKKDIGDKPPELHDMAWSKQLAFDSDLMLALHKKENGYLEVVSRKVRRGRDFMFWLKMDIDNGEFKELMSSYSQNGSDGSDDDEGVQKDVQNSW